MERKSFIRQSAALAGLSFLPKIKPALADSSQEIIIPPYLKAGDIIGITSPSGYFRVEELNEATKQIQRWGFGIKIGKTIGERDGNMGGTDQQRAEDFQQMLDDPSVKAIMCARGGYGIVRIIDKIDFSRFRKHPKWIIGFSDITVFHIHIATNYRVATLHSKMCNSFPLNFLALPAIQQAAINSIAEALQGNSKMKYSVPYDNRNRPGRAEGRIIGGNLCMIETLSGTISEIKTDNKMLFIEDTGEYLYSIDRMLWNLKRNGKFDKLNGLIVGGFNVRKQTDPAEEMTESLYDLVLEKVKGFDFPVCFGFPVGHQIANFALKCNVQHRLSVTDSGAVLEEI